MTATIVSCLSLLSLAQSTGRGTLSGTVTADQGQVVGFRVAAHNLDRRLWYTVFTNKGKYTVPQALPGRYEVMINEPGYESPTVSVQLGAGDSKAANVMLKQKQAKPEEMIADEMLLGARRGNSTKKIVYVNSMEDIFPPGPGQDLGELDPATGKQIRYVIPQQGLDVGITVDKDDNVGFALIWGSLFGRLDAKTRTIHTYPTSTPDNGIYGLAFDQSGNLWGAGWQKGTISKWDAETQLVKEYQVPSAWGQIRRIGVDSKGIVWGSAYNVGIMVRLDPQTGKITEYKIPISGAIPYEAWPDKSDNIWTADQNHSALIKLDPNSGKSTFYPMPQPLQSVPKMEVETNNTIWFGSRGVPIAAGVHFYPNG